ncbi:ferritin heavy chain-like isoform X2 [Pristis pectinata]|uniref:ferritin heavy chain-like isoform X2 n=1 Tax=Pristis pectinata TaxID=685728 RepID=UPI00223D4F6E|nr:ferritin heavy chain-like isoform X2 [Pristis pectinata]
MGSLRGVWPAVVVGLQLSRGLLCRLKGRVGPPLFAGGRGQLRRAAQGGRGDKNLGRQNYSRECEEAINKQINQELRAFYVYLSMSYYFDRCDVALRNFAKFYLEQSAEEQKHAEKLMKFQNQRGGRIILYDIKKPYQDEWGSGLEAMEHALELEKEVNQCILNLHKLASEQNDPNLCEFLESNYLSEQVAAIRKLGDHITNLKRLGAPENGMGEYLFDRHSLGKNS